MVRLKLVCPKSLDKSLSDNELCLVFVMSCFIHFLSMKFCIVSAVMFPQKAINKSCGDHQETWGRGWMTKASGVGERRKGRGELRRDCHHRVAALFVPTRMQQWYIDIWYIYIYNNDIYGGGGRGGPFRGKNHVMSLGSPGIRAKARL